MVAITLFSGWLSSVATLFVSTSLIYFLSLLRRAPWKHGAPKRASGWPIVGSIDFYRCRQQFWRSEKNKSASGQFSFSYGPFNIVALSGHAARESFYASRGLDLLPAFYKLYAAAPEIEFFGRDLADTFLQTFKKFVQRDYLAANLGNFVSDASKSLAAIKPNVPMDPFEHVFLLIYQLSHRSLGCNDIADDPKLLRYTMEIVRAIDWTSGFQIMFTGLPTIPRIKKYLAGLKLYRIMNKILKERQRTGRRDTDTMQVLMDQGYSNTLISCFIVAGIFAAVTNTGNQAAWVLCHLAQNRDWYDRVREEVDAVVAKQRQLTGDKDATALQILQQLSMESWEKDFPLVDLALRESIRLNMAGVSFRLNVAPENVEIAGSKEIIPPRTYAVYDMDDIHLDASIYADPRKWDPSRYLPGREEHKKQAHGYLGWGSGLHPCPGQRFAQLEVTLTTVMFMANYDFQLCDKVGRQWTEPLPFVDHDGLLGTKRPKELVHLKCVPRA
ncbi:cytochrome P450 [Coniochaeta ligniaria NRRL 30616]|uniref:Cytochrome P450 n=1 Tax=Coniochaeta ligniaria NRRL 30616 TaxID=1408157 RepID=A0A1J7J0P1_9PEZI|nr:cytochrome P450 [Coniochaeta ligniaria NRRL 30616]